jgi:hypothetical protein
VSWTGGTTRTCWTSRTTGTRRSSRISWFNRTNRSSGGNGFAGGDGTESPNTYEDIYKVISNILEKKITKEHLTNYLKHSYKIYKS